jgi:hypothetical protein
MPPASGTVPISNNLQFGTPGIECRYRRTQDQLAGQLRQPGARSRATPRSRSSALTLCLRASLATVTSFR